MTARVLVITRGLLAFPIQFDQRELKCVDEPRFPCFCVSAVDYQKQIGVRTREKEIGGSGGSLEPPLGLFLRTSIPFV
jgi:hypothetical protein